MHAHAHAHVVVHVVHEEALVPTPWFLCSVSVWVAEGGRGEDFPADLDGRQQGRPVTQRFDGQKRKVGPTDRARIAPLPTAHPFGHTRCCPLPTLFAAQTLSIAKVAQLEVSLKRCPPCTCQPESSGGVQARCSARRSSSAARGVKRHWPACD